VLLCQWLLPFLLIAAFPASLLNLQTPWQSLNFAVRNFLGNSVSDSIWWLNERMGNEEELK